MGRFGFGLPAVREVLPLRFRTAVQRPVVPAVSKNYRPRRALRFRIVKKKLRCLGARRMEEWEDVESSARLRGRFPFLRGALRKK